MTKLTWIFVGIFTALAAIGFLGFSVWEKNRMIAELKAQRSEAAQAANAANARVADLEREKESVAQAQKGLEEQMRAALKSRDVAISELRGKLTVTILDRILFDTGEAALKPEGEMLLQEIADVLAAYPNRQIHVIGHTDNVPIRTTSWSRYPTNWELSAARATAAVRFLQERAGVDPRRLGAVGQGEYHPIADNSTAEGRAKNRRITVVVLPEELAVAESPSSPEPRINTISAVAQPIEQVPVEENSLEDTANSLRDADANSPMENETDSGSRER